MNTVHFSSRYADVLNQLKSIDPVKYGQSRNYLNGAVTRLSPYISRGVISTRFVLDTLLDRGFDFLQMEKLVQELAWRDYWQLVWIEKKNLIETDLRFAQSPVVTSGIPRAISSANTGIKSIDKGIADFLATGYMHNHLRMYVAAMTCNFGWCHWKEPARWMYYHLLDGDWASNALSWQWVAGTNSTKKYIFNQENLNKYADSTQQNTFLDVPYEQLPPRQIPVELQETILPELPCNLPAMPPPVLNQELPLLIYTSYNLDPRWHDSMPANRILLLEPSHFTNYPVSDSVLRFIRGLTENIPGIQVFTGEFSELTALYTRSSIRYKEHPFSSHFTGIQESRQWLTDVKGFYPSFFAFWKKASKVLQHS